jgi:hypothetical protein
MRWILFFFTIFSLSGLQIEISGKVLEVEIADTPEKHARGLMGRTILEEGKGMLFVYDKAQRLSFWMKNTLVPLSIAFFDDDKTIINILDMDPPLGDLLLKYRSTAPARYALEVPQGWFDKHKIDRGAKFSFLGSSNQVN